MAISVRAQATEYAIGITPAVAALPSAVEAGDVIVFLTIFAADAAVTDLSAVPNLTQGAQSVDAVVSDVYAFESGTSEYSVVSCKLTVTTSLAAQIVADDAYSLAGSIVPVGPGSISRQWTAGWWIDADGGGIDVMPSAADANELSAVATASDTINPGSLTSGIQVFLAGAEGPAADSTISALTMAWTGASASSSLNRTASGGAWEAVRGGYVTPAAVPQIDLATNDLDDTINLLVVAGASLEVAAAPTTADPTFQLAPRARKVHVRELPFEIHTGMIGGIQPQRKQLGKRRHGGV